MSYTTYLAHHGIKGQKWGVRRFQNYDGTRIKSSMTKIKAPKGLYYKWKTMKDGRKVYDRTESGQKFHDLAEPIALNAAKKLDISGKASKRYKESSIAEWAANGGVKFNDIRDDYLRIYADKLERDTSHDYLRVYNQTHDAFSNIKPSHGRDGAYTILHEVVGNAMTKTVWKPASAELPTWRESPFYKLQNQDPNSPEVKALYADFLKHGKALYKKESRLIELMKEPRGSSTGEYKQLMKDLGYRYDDTSIRADWGPHAEEPYSEKWRKRMLNPDKGPPDLFDERLYNRIHNFDTEEVSHSVIVNDDIYSYRSYLAHHGIKGQKWGVRRFQKADGSLTAAGAKRYGIKGAMSAGRKVGSGLVKAARSGIQKAKEVKARKAAEKLERQKKVWAKTRLGLTMNADKFSIEELREANSRLDERDRAARGLAEQVKRGVGYFQAIRDVTGAIKDTKDYIEDISGEKGKKAKAADELKYQRELEKEKRTYERDMVRDQVKANQEYEYKREKDRLDRESKEKIEKMKAKAKKKKDSGSSDPDPEPDEAPKKKASRESTTEFEDVYWNSPKKDREFMETLFPKEVDEAKERKKRRNKARREVDEAIRRMGFFGHSDISTYGAYLAHHGIKGQKWGIRRFQNYDGTRINKNHTSNAADTKQAAKTLNSSYKKYMRAVEEWDDDGMDKAISQLGHDKSFQRSVKPVVDIVNSTYEKHKDVFDKSNDAKSEKMRSYLDDLQKIDDCVKSTAKKLGIKDTVSDSYEYNFFTNALAGYIDSMDQDENRRFLQSDWIVHGVLEHHGIKGQKWGIRRFQNEDGTRIIKKGTRFKRTSIHEDDPTFDDKKYVSTNNRDARKWRDYLGNAYAQRGRIVYEHEYKTTKDIAVARGKDISAVINEEFKKNPKKWKQLNADTERAMKMLNYVKDNMSDDDRYSTNFAAQTNSGKEIMRALQKRGYDAVEDLHGRNVSDDPIIVFNPDENLKHKKVRQHWEYYYRNMYGG